MRRSLRALVAAPVVATVAFGSLLAAPVANAADNTITVWVDEKRIAIYSEVFASGTYAGYKINLVPVDFGTIPDKLKSVSPGSAPDVIAGAHEWTGDLAASGLIVKLKVPTRTIKLLSSSALQGFRYGSGIYGIPTQFGSVAMITNANLIKTHPKSWNELATQALALKKAGKVDVPFAVPQGANGDAYHMYPLFSGLGGYVFGTKPSGSVNVKDVGLYNKTFRQNMALINGWNKTGLIDSKVDYGIAKTSFTTGKSPFWITGPRELAAIKTLPFKYRITPVPAMVAGLTPVPFLDIQGVMVTKYAAEHGVQVGANSLVTQFMARAPYQAKLAAADGRIPANKLAAANMSDRVLKAFAAASDGGVPTPNVPQAASVWGALGGAWVNSTKGAGAVPARKSFARAQATVKKAIAG